MQIKLASTGVLLFFGKKISQTQIIQPIDSSANGKMLLKLSRQVLLMPRSILKASELVGRDIKENDYVNICKYLY